jgi:hypothetical protein
MSTFANGSTRPFAPSCGDSAPPRMGRAGIEPGDLGIKSQGGQAAANRRIWKRPAKGHPQPATSCHEAHPPEASPYSRRAPCLASRGRFCAWMCPETASARRFSRAWQVPPPGQRLDWPKPVGYRLGDARPAALILGCSFQPARARGVPSPLGEASLRHTRSRPVTCGRSSS